MHRVARAAVLLAVVIVTAGSARAVAWTIDPDNDWDLHFEYPPVPSGRASIDRTFGAPCNDAANDNSFGWRAADDGKVYTVRYHRKLGGGASSNLYPDVRKHHTYGGYDDNTKRGIWGYACRYISGTSKWSAHAWGIAVDINSAYEPVGDSTCNTISRGHGQIWTDHGWTWGKAWRDCMHFQYAKDY